MHPDDSQHIAARGKQLPALKRAGAIDGTGNAAILAVGSVALIFTACAIVAWFMRLSRTRSLMAFA